MKDYGTINLSLNENIFTIARKKIHYLFYSWFAHDVISCHWASSWLTLQITSAVYSEVLVSIYYFIVNNTLVL